MKAALVVSASTLLGVLLTFLLAQRCNPPLPDCIYPNSTDSAEIIWLVEAESRAVLERDLVLIRQIFSERAIIRDANPSQPREWTDPIARYAPMFEDAEYLETTHSDYEINPGPGDTYRCLSASSGRWIDSLGVEHRYNNPPGSDRWTFGRNKEGCWVITELIINASHLPVP